ncbi:antibiotic transporter [Cellulosimicrobium funkei]|uniref:Antibiotic transporter n=2 Tax=Cellulosimicrobium TaxID=157920 RepID=A0A0H2KNX9_9MICO|nr:MFS transporter [Cellulosimicrobium funkei]KLN33529.1 antibiotic transporter [Cellulosimicrobium funkei]
MSRLGEIVVPRRMGTGFRWLLSSSWTSNVGDGIALAAAPLLVASQTDSAFLVALAALLQQLPWLLFGLWAGALADRLDRRVVVMVANALRALVVVALCVVIATGHVSIGVVLAVTFLYGVAEVFADSASQTLLPMLVEPRDLGTGNARLQAGFLTANQLLGPPIGAFLFALGTVWPFVVQVVCVALAVVLVGRITMQPGGVRETQTHVRQDIAEGVRWILGNAPVRTLALVILAFNVTWAAPWGVLVKYALDHLDMGEVGFGLLTTASAVGGVIGIASFGWLERHLRLSTIMRVCLSLEVVMHLALALTTTGWVALAIMVVFGAYAFVWGTVSNTIRQRAVPTEFQGRVGSVYMVCVFGGSVVGQALGGILAQTWGITAPFWFAFVGAGVTLALVWRQLGHVAHAGEVPAAD